MLIQRARKQSVKSLRYHKSCFRQGPGRPSGEEYSGSTLSPLDIQHTGNEIGFLVYGFPLESRPADICNLKSVVKWSTSSVSRLKSIEHEKSSHHCVILAAGSLQSSVAKPCHGPGAM